MERSQIRNWKDLIHIFCNYHDQCNTKDQAGLRHLSTITVVCVWGGVVVGIGRAVKYFGELRGGCKHFKGSQEGVQTFELFYLKYACEYYWGGL